MEAITSQGELFLWKLLEEQWQKCPVKEFPSKQKEKISAVCQGLDDDELEDALFRQDVEIIISLLIQLCTLRCAFNSLCYTS